MVIDWLLHFRPVSSSARENGTSAYSPGHCRENVHRDGNELLVIPDQTGGRYWIGAVWFFQPATMNPACGVDVSRPSSQSELGSPQGAAPNHLANSQRKNKPDSLPNQPDFFQIIFYGVL